MLAPTKYVHKFKPYKCQCTYNANKPLALPESIRHSHNSPLPLLVHVFADQPHTRPGQGLQRAPCHVPTCDRSKPSSTSQYIWHSIDHKLHLFNTDMYMTKPPSLTISWSSPWSLLQRRCLFAVFPLKAPIQKEPVKTCVPAFVSSGLIQYYSVSSAQVDATYMQNFRFSQEAVPIRRIIWKRGWFDRLLPSGCSTKKRKPLAKHTRRQRQSREHSKFPILTKSYPSLPSQKLKTSLPAVCDDLRLMHKNACNIFKKNHMRSETNSCCN